VGDDIVKSIQHKIAVACIAVLGLTSGGGAISIWATGTLNESTVDLNRIAQVLHYQMQADMMHDAIRGDVLAATLAANGDSGLSLSTVKTDLDEHLAEFSHNSHRISNPCVRTSTCQFNS
jgi:methyl-accepting chemotaxis protein